MSPSAAQQRILNGTLARIAEKVPPTSTIGVEFPHITSSDGSWITLPASLSAAPRHRVEPRKLALRFLGGPPSDVVPRNRRQKVSRMARERMRLVAQRADYQNTHDIGFIFDSSAIPGSHVTGDRWYAEIALRAADKLRARIVNTRAGSYLASGGPLSDERARRSSAIDAMANLPLLYFGLRGTRGTRATPWLPRRMPE